MALNQYELVTTYNQRIEDLLENRLGAVGRGIHEKVTSVEDQLDPRLIKQMRWIASMRNNVSHSDGFDIADLPAFERACAGVVESLRQLPRIDGLEDDDDVEPAGAVPRQSLRNPLAGVIHARSTYTKAVFTLSALAIVAGVALAYIGDEMKTGSFRWLLRATSGQR